MYFQQEQLIFGERNLWRGVSGEIRDPNTLRAPTSTCVKEVDDKGNPSDGILGESSVVISENADPRTDKRGQFSVSLPIRSEKRARRYTVAAWW